MPQKVWVVGEEVLAADFNTYVQQQVVPAFPNTTARDTWTSAPEGALAVTVDTGITWQRVGGAWVIHHMAPNYYFGSVFGGASVSGQTRPQIFGFNANGNTNAGGQFTVAFPAPFAEPPIVVACGGGSGSFYNVHVLATVTTTQFTVVVVGPTGTTIVSAPVSINYIAFGRRP